MTTVIDTDALLGLFIPQDVHHHAARHIIGKLAQLRCTIIIPPTALCEFALLASSRIGMQQTQEAVETLTDEDFRAVAITAEIMHEAVTLYRQQTSKEESLFDCFVMVTAKRIAADCIFSFDRGYKKNGFVLIEEFLASSVKK